MPGPKHEEALHGEVGKGDDRHPGREDCLQQTPSLKIEDSDLCLFTHSLEEQSGPGKPLI